MNRLLSKFLLLLTAEIFILWHLAPSRGLSQSELVTITFGHIQRLDSRIDELVPADATLEVMAEGFTWLEGPVWDKVKDYLLFSDIPGNAIYKWQPRKGAILFMQPSGYTGDKPFDGREPGSNGL